MLMMYMYSLFMLMIFFFLMIFSMMIYYMKMSIMIEWIIYFIQTSMVEIFILIDWISLLFMSFVMLISSSVILYSIIYMSGEVRLFQFVYLVLLFVISMLMMIISPSLISILFGWDMLGLVSYCLVIYYSNASSFNSGMVTVLSNRIGDVGLLLSIGISLMYGSWNIFMLEKMNMFLFFMIFIAAITKSAQMPFSSWLPMAMAAPTPVSSLVHSSTLVTAGVYLIIRFNYYIYGGCVSMILLFISILTMFMSGLMANYEIDFKKIIALSTLSQLGLMMMILSLGVSMLGMYHLLTHAIFKSVLFMCAGIIIHSMKDNQDIRKFGGMVELLPFTLMIFFISSLALMGFPFLAGFYSKDLIMEMTYIFEVNFIMLMLVILSLLLTVLYSLRLMYYVFFSSFKFNVNIFIYESLVMSISMIFLGVLSCSVGSLLSWMFFIDLPMIYLKDLLKLFIIMLISGSLLLWLLNLIFIKSFLKNKKLMYFLISMWFMNQLSEWSSKILIYKGMIVMDIDIKWLEILEVSFFSKIKLYLVKFYYSNYFIYQIIMSQGILIIMIMLFLL